MEKMLYDLDVLNVFRMLTSQLQHAGIQLDTRFWDYHNDTCPKCRQTLKKQGKSVKGIEMVAACVLGGTNLGVPYGLCKFCSKESESLHQQHKRKELEEWNRTIEEYIEEKLEMKDFIQQVQEEIKRMEEEKKKH